MGVTGRSCTIEREADCGYELSAEQSLKQWSVLCALSRHEKAVRERLSRKGYEEFLPAFIRTSRCSDSDEEGGEALIPWM